MLKKLRKRIHDTQGLHSHEDNLRWITHHCSNFSTMAKELDPALWKETEEVSIQLKKHAQHVLATIPYTFGGGGVYPFLYFLTRYTHPETIVETGVATGLSSYAFLSAMKTNGKGTLHSSDFPYLRLPNPERYIGIVVADNLKENWHLYIEGDEFNLPKILETVQDIDLFHYDSDKSYSGRKFAMSKVENRMKKNGIILIDDIQDNSFFYDYVEMRKVSNWKVFEFEGKYIGMIGIPEKALTSKHDTSHDTLSHTTIG